MKYTGIKKFIAAVLCAAAFVKAFSPDASAEEIDRITILGDSIAEGYGLEDEDKNYGVWLGEYFDADVKNFAASGETTQELIDIIDSDANVKDSIKESELICVSIGANDILQLFFDDLKSMADSYNSSPEGKITISPEAVENIIVSISTAIGPASANAGKNIDVIAGKISDLNPEAKLVLQTVYNPFEPGNESFKNLFSPLYTFASIYLSAVNNAVRSGDGIINADIQRKFKGYCPLYTNMNMLDIHPNKLGHLIIAEEIVQTLKISGKNNVFINGFSDMTSESSENFPEEIKNEIKLLSEGIFRKEELPTEAETESVTEEITEASTEAVIAKSPSPKPASAGGAAILTELFVIVFLAAIFFVVIPIAVVSIVNKYKIKKTGAGKK